MSTLSATISSYLMPVVTAFSNGILFIFSVIYFGVLSDTGLFDVIVGWLVKRAGNNVIAVTVVTALIATIAHLDGTTAVTVYSNIGIPKVYLNGQELSGIRNGYTDVHYVFDNVSLADGKNILKAVVSTKGKEYTDEIEWNYSGEKNREIDSYENKNEHSGF